MPNEQKDDQAIKLQQLFQEVNNQQSNEKKPKITEEELIEVDVLNLPPRSEVHQKTALRFEMNVHRPFWRFVFVIILLAVIISVVYYMFGEQIILLFT